MSTQLLQLQATAGATKSATGMFEQLAKALEADGESLVKQVKGLVVFKVDDEEWSLDLREGQGQVYQGPPKEDKPDITLTISDANFAQLVMGKLNPQQAFLMRKLKINGSMGLAMKLQPILEAAKPKAKL